jgi:epoxyqueuosine reductase
MNGLQIHKVFKNEFDVVGVIKTDRYLSEAKKRGLIVPSESFKTLVVLALAYPKRIIHNSKTHLVPSFYTFGSDYHVVLKNRILKAMLNLPYKFNLGVDNHPHNERLAAVLAGIGFFGKNQLIINKDFGSYIFLGMVFIDTELDQEIINEVNDDCGDCVKCLQACPTKAITETGFEKDKCISYYNQAKRNLTDKEMTANYALFGCDICQVVCPKNIEKGKTIHPEFELNGKEKVSIKDLFTLSDKEFRNTYSNMSYLWKGKTILMRNAAILLAKHKNNLYNELLAKSISEKSPNWYVDSALKALTKLKGLKYE